MKKKLLSLLMCGIVSSSLLYGCGVKIDPVDGYNDTDEYEIISSSNISSYDDEIITVKDKNTGKIFKIYKGHCKGGITEVSK